MRPIIVSLFVAIACLIVASSVALSPAVAADIPACTPATWDPETRTVTQDVPSDYPGTTYFLVLDTRGYRDCTTTYPNPARVVINLTKPLEFSFGTENLATILSLNPPKFR